MSIYPWTETVPDHPNHFFTLLSRAKEKPVQWLHRCEGVGEIIGLPSVYLLSVQGGDVAAWHI